MTDMIRTGLAVLFLLLLAQRSASAAGLERVRVGADGRGFVLGKSSKTFAPWGFNYGPTGKLVDDDWETNWDVIERDFRAMHALGANVVRVHLQVSRFMDSADQVNERSLDRLLKLLDLSA